VCGSLPFSVESNPDKFYAGSLVLGPNGEQLARYNKVHLFDVDVDDSVGQYRESDTYAAGNDIVSTKVFGWILGLSVCYDLRFPELYQAHFKGGAQIISVPSAFTYSTGKAHWEVLLKARAIETQSYIVAANQTGSHSSTRQTWGHSMIVDPWGEVIASCASEVGYCMAEVEQETINSVRRNMPLIQHKRLI
jgi:deaminated glutathione amidase